MPLDFPPSSASPWTGSNGVTYVWDGQKWVVSGSGGSTAYLPLSGGTMTGPIALAADPTTSSQAANKYYVDQSINLAGNYLGTWAVASNTPNISAGGSISNANYVATTVAPGTPETVPAGVPGIAGMTVANGDRVIWAAGLGVWQILRNAGVTLAAADARYYAITNPSGYQTAAQVTTALAPYALLASPSLIGNPTAPTPAPGDNDTSIATTAFVQAATGPYANNVGRNLLHNGQFNVQQRGQGGWNTTSTFTADRWIMGFAGGTFGVSLGALSDAARALIGDEAAKNAAAIVCTGGSAATDESYFEQRIEDVRRTAGKTVTLSFWANPTSGTPKLGCMMYQSFGSGGSPSAIVLIPGQAVTLSTSPGWTRYSLTFSLPSVSGKTFGTTAGTDVLCVRFGMSAGSSKDAQYGGIGVQSYTLQLWGVQMEIGGAATPLEKPDPQQDLAKCQRFYQGALISVFGYQAAGAPIQYTVQFPTTMRATPTVVLSNQSYTNASAAAVGPVGVGFAAIQATTTALGQTGFVTNYAASADL